MNPIKFEGIILLLKLNLSSFSIKFLNKIFVSRLYQNKTVIKEIAKNTIAYQVCTWSLHTANPIIKKYIISYRY